MKLYIPELGEKITLLKDWSFKLILESRNEKLVEYFYPDKKLICTYRIFGSNVKSNYALVPKEIYNEYYKVLSEELFKSPNRNKSEEFISNNINDFIYEEIMDLIKIPSGTELSFDRIYIRKGNKDFSSVTFYAKIPDIKKKIRFFAKLEDVNKIEFTKE